MNDGSLKIDVLRVNQPIGEFFIASMDALDLVDITYADVRRLVREQRDVEMYLGIQRPVSNSRVKKLRKYVTSPDATFPTSIIVAVDERCAEYDANDRKLHLHPYDPDEYLESEDAVSTTKIAKVIDGQHRLAAFLDQKGDLFPYIKRGDFELNVAIFVGADIAEQANIFATVNLAQTKVNKSLVYDLTELAKTRSPHKTCHNIAVMLDEEETSPLYRRIKRLGTATPGRRREPLTQAAFVEALAAFISSDPENDRRILLKGGDLSLPDREEWMLRPFRDLFIKDQELDIAEVVYNYFTAVREKWPISWSSIDEVGNLLPRSNAFKALMKFLKDDVYIQAVEIEGGRVPSIEVLYQFFEPVDFRDEDFRRENFAPGSGGQSTFLKMLRGEILLEDMIQK